MGKHITDAQRLTIEHRLREHASLKSIAREIGKSLKIGIQPESGGTKIAWKGGRARGQGSSVRV
jgi:hypothetical protein